MTPEEWERIKVVLDKVLDLVPADRTAYLADFYAREPALRSEVESLLHSYDEAGVFLETPCLGASVIAPKAHTPDIWIGRHLGAYRLVERIGSGGMGIVYRAARADGHYQKQVAVKLIQGAFGTDYFLSRFKDERQILASFDHPNIAGLLDGGTTEDGLPYVVMEYVDGVAIDRYCDTRQLPIPERLELFRTVCSAVQYAHEHRVVHRDLKPGNILVTREGIPKLLDFGIAKIVDPGDQSV
jgi:eukaryotic-like serine/threonine-protein kinase